MPYKCLPTASLLICLFCGIFFAWQTVAFASPGFVAASDGSVKVSSDGPADPAPGKENLAADNSSGEGKERIEDAALRESSGSFTSEGIGTGNSDRDFDGLSDSISLEPEITETSSGISPASFLFAGEVGVGVTAAERMFIDKSKASVSGNFVPYGRLRLRLGNGGFLRPEIIVEESGSFKFDRSGIKNGNSSGSYGYYYLKIPLGIHIPFFSYRSFISMDASYRISENGIEVKNRTLVNNGFYDSGSKFEAVSSEMLFRLYFNTPVVKNPNFFEYSYFGFFYSENILPRTTFAPSNTLSYSDMLVETNVRSGGIFYDMKKDTLLRRLNFDVAVYVGYGNIEVMDSVSQASAEFGNLDDVLSIGARGGLGYRYMFGKNFGAAFNLGVSYFATTEFLSTADDAKYGVNTGGDLRYYAALNFIFGY